MTFVSTGPPLASPADNVTLPQAFLDDKLDHPTVLRLRPDVPCLIDETTGRQIYLDELKSRTHCLAKALKSNWSICSEDIIAMFSPNHIDYPVCIWATHRLGATVAVTSPALTVDELVYQLRIAKPSLLLAHMDNISVALQAAKLIDLPSSRIIVLGAQQSNSSLPYITLGGLIQDGQSLPNFDEHVMAAGEAKSKIAFLCFSSGTTGKPKAVSISHYNVICNVVQFATFNRIHEQYAPWEQRRFRPGDVCSGVLPLYHIYGLVTNLHFIIYARMTLVVQQKFDFGKMLDSITRYRITHLMIVPPQAVLLCKHPAARNSDLSSIRYCMVAGAPVTSELTKQLLERLPDVQLGQAYGMTETCAAVSIFPVTQKIGTLGSGGQLVSGTTAKVVKTDGTLAQVGETGELHVKGGQVAIGYYRNEEATNEVFVNGWMRTGDEVMFHPNGNIFIVDRIKEIIKVKGLQVAPAELEGHLLGHPDVADAGVIGIPDDYSGEVPLAFIVLQSEIAEIVAKDAIVAAEVRSRIFKHVSNVKSQHKWLTGGIEFIEILPKTPSGKILRRVLRERARNTTRALHTKL